MCALLITRLPEIRQPQGPIEFVELTWEERSRPRRKFVTDAGTEVAFALQRGTVLSDGDTIFNTEEKTVVVKARNESLLSITPGDIQQACVVAHHLGNWHRCLQLTPENQILTEPDEPLCQWLDKERINYRQVERVYEPNLRTSAHS